MKVTVQLTEPADPVTPPMSPMLKHVLSSRVLYALSIPPPKRSGIWKLQTWIIASLLMVSTVLFWLSYRAHDTLRETFLANSKTHADRPNVFRPDEPSLSTQPARIYGVVFDAGSTGSRVHVFELTRQNQKDEDAPLTLTDELFEQVHPGLSSYADNPEQAAESLQPLLKAALKRVPSGHCSNTSVVLRATAGLRLLSAHKADNILAAVRQMLSQSCLLQSTNAVSILDGNLEGLYLWISLNVMTGRMPSPNSAASESRHALDHTVGTLDLGGGSTQITFAPRIPDTLVNAPEGYATAIDSGQTVRKTELKPGKHVYSQSYLGLGLMSARYSMLHTITKRLPAKTILGNDLFTSCFPPDIAINWSHGGRDWRIRYLPMNQSTHTLLEFELTDASTSLQLEHSSHILTNCYAHALQVLRDPVDGDSTATVYPPSGFVVHRPDEIINHEFYAFSYIFDLAQSVGIVKSQSGEQVTIAQFRDATNRVCNNPNPNEPFQCMDLAFITALLHDGYGFPWEKKIILQKKVKSFEISWGLGALFAELSSHQSR
ncbi:ectonucleoside triphosphate diphosphohydrolase 5/6 [Paragonimus westermani]|uniref:Ectonucleoside triphosphate diphosphohydrolase 5/6 n=1 Tax=Paragonimus westermani TaxID=34504 RepID=A0A5J4P1B2_9TREM|nr:ectonucleoside triphosphate diphosphohydrolase 5/6 [Paragonimus westermani]